MKTCCRHFFPAVAILLHSCSGDSHISSDAVDTHEIYATLQVFSDGGNNVFAEAQLTQTHPPEYGDDATIYVSLTETDQLWIHSGDDFQPTTSSNLFDALKRKGETQVALTHAQKTKYSVFLGQARIDGEHYTATMPRDDLNQYRIALMRENFTDAVDSHVSLPLDFTIHSPEMNDTYSRSNDVISIEWSPIEPDVQVTVQVNTSCPSQTEHSASYTRQFNQDSGIFIIEPGTLVEPSLTGSCSSVINVIRTRLGTIDSAFIGGHAAGNQIRSLSITTTN